MPTLRSNRLLTPIRAAATLLLVASLVLGCTTDDDGSATMLPTELSVAVASFDLAVGDDRRLLAGVFTPERQLLVGGEVEFALVHLGEADATSGSVDARYQATFVPVPGLTPAQYDPNTDTPQLSTDTGTGVYRAHVNLPDPGFWGLRVRATFSDGSVAEGQQRFMVHETAEVLQVGDAMPRIENFTVADVAAGRIRPVAVDSRAQNDTDPIPDTHLHDTRIVDLIDAGRAIAVVVATPVYCVSRFCGPLVEVISELADEFPEVGFVHLEVWEDFDARQLNAAAAALIQTETGGNEPWVFVADRDGTVVARWDNVLDESEFRRALDQVSR